MDDERNVEIKAYLGSDEDFEGKIKLAEDLTSTKGEVIVQKDIFFKSLTGRLKLRYIENGKSQLIHYDRPDIPGPKLSKYNKIEIDEPEMLEKMLSASNGVRGVIKKQRLLFLHKGTRIHLDKVEGLGNFLEFEVCLAPEQSISEGQDFANKLLSIFGITDDCLITSAYIDSLEK